MMEIEEFLGEKVTKILTKLNVIYTPSKGEALVDEAIFLFETRLMRILPVDDTDEIRIDCSKMDDFKNRRSLKPLPGLDQYIGKTLSSAWNCTNTRGYFDMFVLGFYYLNPTLIFLSEGGVLKLLEVGPTINRPQQGNSLAK